jgi:hypothetical protein
VRVRAIWKFLSTHRAVLAAIPLLAGLVMYHS